MKTERETTEEIIGLIRKKKDIFKEFEEVTEQMLTDSFDDIDRMVSCIDQREKLIERIDALDLLISDFASQSGNEEIILRASKNLCNFSELKPEYQEIFTVAQEVFGSISRIQALEPQIIRNMTSMMEELQKRIRQNKQNTKISGYMNSLGIKASKGVFYDKKR